MKHIGTNLAENEPPFEDFQQAGVTRKGHFRTEPVDVTFSNGRSSKYVLGNVRGQWRNPEVPVLRRMFTKPYPFGYVYLEDLVYGFDVGESNDSRITSVPIIDYGHSRDLPRDGIEDAVARRQNIQRFVGDLELIATSLEMAMPTLVDFNPHRLYSS
jgi:hypothetical protein